MVDFKGIFNNKKAVIGMIHLPPLPGTPEGRNQTFRSLTEFALSELEALEKGGANGAIVENFWDYPYLPNRVSPLTLSVMAAVAGVVTEKASIPIGVNILYNDFKSEIALARSVRAAFIRAEVFVDTAYCESGIINPSCAEIIRERALLGADETAIFADVHGKNTAPMWNRSLIESAQDAQDRGRADAIIITGAGTGKSAALDDVKEVREKIKIPMLVGSGVNPKTVKQLFEFCDGAIIGSFFKKEGKINNPTDSDRVRELIEALK